ncbi:MAG: hypothetical protein QOG35_1611 [Solirubrobacteraceae bacterium]|jgi:hypothetical protein|nr:hypothetical protein [Solirubrobacteraceae bacterium]
MTTVQIAIVCVSALAAILITSRARADRDTRRAQLRRETAMHERAAAAPAAQLAAAVDALTLAAGALQHRAGQAGPSRVGHRVTIHTKLPDDQTVFGVVVGDYADRLSLEDSEYVSPHGPVAMSGRQDIATRDIAWVDVHGHVAIPDRAPAEDA